LKLDITQHWGPNCLKAAFTFVKEAAPTADFFCFQEVLEDRVFTLLPTVRIAICSRICAKRCQIFTGYFLPVQEGNVSKFDPRVAGGQVMFCPLQPYQSIPQGTILLSESKTR